MTTTALSPHTLAPRAALRDGPALRVRRATPADVDALAALNREAYPDLVEEGVVFDAKQIALHQARFPEGQLVLELEEPARDLPAGALVGALATLALPSAHVLGPHTWYEATADGTFDTHDPGGDALYLADVYVGRAAWGLGLGPAAYRALFDLCRAGGFARVVAGGRLYSYFAYRDRLTPEQYVLDVTHGRIRDRVLGGQLRAGFEVLGILPGYLQDARSCDYATLLEWARRA